MNGPWGYDLRPQQIEDKSFEIIDGLADLSRFSAAQTALVKRVIHATGDPSFVDILAWSTNAIDAASQALRGGAPIVTDVNMVRAGVSKLRVDRFGGEVHCYIADPEIADQARARGVTRSILAVEKAVARHPEAVFAFGNAPTALFRLLELVDEGKANPAAVVGVVVGFVGAAESKDALMVRAAPPWVSCRGNKGGSNVAAAIVNALLKVAAREV